MGSRLAQFIGDGARADGFEELQKFTADLRTAYPDADTDTKRLVRFMTAVSIACVEVAAQEFEQNNDAMVQIVHAMCAGTAVAMTSAVLSVLRDDTPAEVLREIITTSFEAGLEQTIKSNGLA